MSDTGTVSKYLGITIFLLILWFEAAVLLFIMLVAITVGTFATSTSTGE